MAVLLLNSSQRLCNTAELHARISDNDIAICIVDHILEFLQGLHDDVFRRLRASVYTFMSKLALLCRRISECTWKLLHLRNLYNLHLHSDSFEALPMFCHVSGLLDSI